MNNKKTLILSIVGVLVLIIVVVGISYAMYRFTGTGARENVITTGTLSVNYGSETSTVNLTNEYPMTDAQGLAQTAGTGESTKLNFTVSAVMTGSTTINYEIGLDKQTSTLADSSVKLNLKKVFGGETTYPKGTSTTGVLVSSFATTKGVLPNTTTPTIAGYYLDNGTLTSTNASAVYELKVWLDENYNLPTTGTGTCAGGTQPTTEADCNSKQGVWNGTACTYYNTSATTCEAIGGTWTDTTTGTHSNATTAQNFVFKIKVYAQQ